MSGTQCTAAVDDDTDSEPETFFDRRVQRPLPPHLTGELRLLAEEIQASIFSANPDVRWDSVVGLADAKKLLKEAVEYPIKYPQFFQGAFASLLSFDRRLPGFSLSVWAALPVAVVATLALSGVTTVCA